MPFVQRLWLCVNNTSKQLWFICLLAACQIVQRSDANSSELKPHISTGAHENFLLNYALNYMVLGLRLCTSAVDVAVGVGVGVGVAFIDKSKLVV